MSAPSQFEPSLLRKIGSSPLVSTKRRRTSSGVIGPALIGPVTGEADAAVGAEVLEERVFEIEPAVGRKRAKLAERIA